MSIPPHASLQTSRLVLRPTEPADAGATFTLQSNRNVTRMLRMAAFPPDRAELGRWFLDHQREWLAGEAYRFAILCDGRFIGVADIDEIAQGEGDLGYWLGEAHWGLGFASEAAGALVDFAFGAAGLLKLRSGHAADNAASGRVLRKLGFRFTGQGRIASRARGVDIVQSKYVLDAAGRPAASG